MELFRKTQEQFADDLTGNGARLFGGRWNSEGVFAVYTSPFRSLPFLETLAHTTSRMLETKIYQLVTLHLPDIIKAKEILSNNLLIGWDVPDVRAYSRKLGDRFFRKI
jgi:RES domain-containing protein